MGPDLIVFFEPNIDCDPSLFDAVEPFEVPILLKCLLYRSTRCNSVLDDIGHTNGRDLRTRTALPDVM